MKSVCEKQVRRASGTIASARSRRVFESASRFITGGVHSNFRYTEPYPRYFSKSRGPFVWDIDGNEFIDCVCNMGACILGHKNPKIIRAVEQQLETGLTVGLETELSVDAAKMLSSMVPSAEVVKFSNTGTEAVMHAIQIARGFTRKTKLAKLEGGFDGWYDYMLVSTHPSLEAAGPESDPVSIRGSEGLARDVDSETIVIPFNNIEDATRIIRTHRNELAAVVMEPVMFNVGCVAPDVDYLRAIREITNDSGILLIFDEVISGFRLSPGGAQKHYGVIPDISTFAKAIANGFPLAAVVGKSDYMNVTNPSVKESLSSKNRVSYLGTYNGNQMSLAAAKACMTQLKDGRVQDRLQSSSNWLLKQFVQIAQDYGTGVRLLSLAGKFQIYFCNQDPTDYRSAIKTDQTKYTIFRDEMLKEGILMHPLATSHHGLTASHRQSELHSIVSAMEKALKQVKRSAH